MDEPSLSCGGDHQQELYRFFYLPSFYNPAAVRLTRTNGGCNVIMTELNKSRLNRQFGFDLGSLRQHVEREVSLHDCDEALRGVTEDFWNLSPSSSESGDDGARWVIEARRANGYHVVDRWGGGELRSIGLRFLTLAKLSPVELR
jgi:hypothetical protein